MLSRVCVCSDIVSGAAAWAREPPPVSGHTCTAQHQASTAHAPAFAVIDVCQLCHSPIRSDVFTSFIDEASGLQSAFTVYYGFDPDLFWAAMIVYAVNVAGRLVLGLLAVVNVDWDEVQLVDGRAWRRVPGLLLMLIEPVSGNKLLESTLEAREVRDLSVTVLRCQIYVGPAGLRPQL